MCNPFYPLCYRSNGCISFYYQGIGSNPERCCTVHSPTSQFSINFGAVLDAGLTPFKQRLASRQVLFRHDLIHKKKDLVIKEVTSVILCDPSDIWTQQTDTTLSKLNPGSLQHIFSRYRCESGMHLYILGTQLCMQSCYALNYVSSPFSHWFPCNEEIVYTFIKTSKFYHIFFLQYNIILVIIIFLSSL